MTTSTSELTPLWRCSAGVDTCKHLKLFLKKLTSYGVQQCMSVYSNRMEVIILDEECDNPRYMIRMVINSSMFDTWETFFPTPHDPDALFIPQLELSDVCKATDMSDPSKLWTLNVSPDDEHEVLKQYETRLNWGYDSKSLEGAIPAACEQRGKAMRSADGRHVSGMKLVSSGNKQQRGRKRQLQQQQLDDDHEIPSEEQPHRSILKLAAYYEDVHQKLYCDSWSPTGTALRSTISRHNIAPLKMGDGDDQKYYICFVMESRTLRVALQDMQNRIRPHHHNYQVMNLRQVEPSPAADEPAVAMDAAPFDFEQPVFQQKPTMNHSLVSRENLVATTRGRQQLPSDITHNFQTPTYVNVRLTPKELVLTVSGIESVTSVIEVNELIHRNNNTSTKPSTNDTTLFFSNDFFLSDLQNFTAISHNIPLTVTMTADGTCLLLMQTLPNDGGRITLVLNALQPGKTNVVVSHALSSF